MNEGKFWGIVESCRGGGGDEEHAARLKQCLQGFDLKELQDFSQIFQLQVDRAFHWDVWAIAHMHYGFCSDDSFEYFRRWMVSLGKVAFEAAIYDPTLLVDPLRSAQESSFEQWGSVPLTLAWEKTGEDTEFQWEPLGDTWEEKELMDRFPKECNLLGFEPEPSEVSQSESHVTPTGLRVSHPKFGVGILVEEDSTGTVQVEFESVGRKHLVKKFANLTVLER